MQKELRMKKSPQMSLGSVIMVFVTLVVIQAILAPRTQQVTYSEFKAYLHEDQIQQVVISETVIHGTLRPDTMHEGQPRTFRTARIPDPNLVEELQERGVTFSGQYTSPFLKALLSWVVPILIFGGLWYFLSRRLRTGNGLMALGKSRAKVYVENHTGITFANVAGQDEAKEELQEIIEFLTTPQKFRLLGGKLPRGVLLVGPPGTGKTLLAKAVAGEAKVPFFSISGSEFVEMFVGMGAARVRDLFTQAQSKAPCIVFIDELDAIGKARGIAGVVGGHDEREQTLNQLLVEMDGFDTDKGVIILAATNRPEVLDPALLRPGRFDRQVLVDRPDVLGREAILRVHVQEVRIAPDVALTVLAQRTPGFVGADLANVVNEAALLAARRNRSQVGMAEFDEAIDRVVAGLEKKNRLINPREREIVAVHETGHALVAALTPGADNVHKISIIPRGIGALGYTQQLPTEDRYLMTQQELQGKIDVLFGGRAAEQVVFGEVSTGAHNDLQRATEIARAMVLEYGMGNALGPVSYARQRQPMFLGQPGDAGPDGQRAYSEATARALDRETKAMLETRLAHVQQLLREKRHVLDRIAALLLEKEVIEAEEFARLVQDETPHHEEAA
jgi:cell division protease FtsH